MKKELVEWWTARHRQDKQYLGRTPGDKVASFLQITSCVQRGTRLLNIGIGIGSCTKWFKLQGARVEVLDICEVALQRVARIVEAGYLDEHDLPSGRYDLAVSHLVAQHMMDADLIAQIREVLRSLKPQRIFAIQFAYIPGRPDKQNLKLCQRGGISRSPVAFYRLAKTAGASVAFLSGPQQMTAEVYWYAAHLTREETCES